MHARHCSHGLNNRHTDIGAPVGKIIDGQIVAVIIKIISVTGLDIYMLLYRGGLSRL